MRVRDNATPSNAIGQTHMSTIEDMMLHDQLPPRIRAAMCYLPWKLAALPLVQQLSHGASSEALEASMWQQLNVLLPDWRPFKSDPL